jgi:glucose-1-phosphate cytidylyltransferase
LVQGTDGWRSFLGVLKGGEASETGKRGDNSMKVVLFCGGLGMRLREYSESIPKPLIEIGYRPILWHVMKYYAHYGHKDFILCLGYKADAVKKYFLNYDECISNDFILKNGGKGLELLASDTSDWNIVFVDTGLHSNIGQRLKAVEQYIGDDDVFLANYADGLTDLKFSDYMKVFEKKNKIASFISVKPTQSFHIVTLRNGHEVTGIKHIADSGMWINGGYFIFKREIFKHIQNGEDLVNEPFARLIDSKQIITFKHTGFWVGMDTFKDKQFLDELIMNGKAPWQVWQKGE